KEGFTAFSGFKEGDIIGKEEGFQGKISFILLLIEWSELDPNVKSQTLVETFDRSNHNSILEYNVALITLLAYPVSACTAERSFSGIKRLQTPLQRTMTDERLNSLAILHIHKH
ncbi:unnamed protein product, partial [Porites lobata]